MSKYIDANKLMGAVQMHDWGKDMTFHGMDELRALIGKLLVEEVTPVVHARWVLKAKISENCFRYNCSHCNRWVQAGAKENPAERFPYCHCGAKMDVEVK